MNPYFGNGRFGGREGGGSERAMGICHKRCFAEVSDVGGGGDSGEGSDRGREGGRWGVGGGGDVERPEVPIVGLGAGEEGEVIISGKHLDRGVVQICVSRWTKEGADGDEGVGEDSVGSVPKGEGEGVTGEADGAALGDSEGGLVGKGERLGLDRPKRDEVGQEREDGGEEEDVGGSSVRQKGGVGELELGGEKVGGTTKILVGESEGWERATVGGGVA